MTVPLNEPKPFMSEPTDEARRALTRLARLRSQVMAWFGIQGLARVLWLALAIFATDLAIDWLFRLDRPQRIVMLWLMAAAIGWAVYRWLWRPLSTQLSDEALALAIESAHPRLGQSFVTALQLARSAAASSAGVSPVLIRRAVELGFRQAQEISFASVVDRRRWRQNLALLAAASVIWLVLLTATIVLWPLQTWFVRNLLLQGATWPQRTYLAIDGLSPDGTIVAPRGEPWQQTVSVTAESRVVPQIVSLEFRDAAGRPPLPLKKIADRQFTAEFAATSLPFDLRARGGDAVTEWTPVRLVEPPALKRLKLIVTPPRYAGAGLVELAPGEGPYAVLPGSSLKIAGQANKPLARATLHYEGERLLERPAADEAPHATPATIDLIAAPRADFNEVITAAVLVAGKYRLELTDLLGLASRDVPAFVLHKRIDQEPQLQAALVGIGDLVTPEATLPYRCQVGDDFGLATVVVRYRYQAGEEPQERTGQWLLAGEEGTAANGETGAAVLPAEFRREGTLPLADLKLAPGTAFTFHFEAADNNNITGPGVGRCSPLLLRVVTPDELRLDLFRREKQQRQLLERLIKDQEDLLTDNQSLATVWRAGNAAAGATSGETRSELQEAVKRQQAIGSGVAAIARAIHGLASEVQNNRLEEGRGRLQTRLIEEVARPLGAVASETSPRAATALREARPPAPASEVRLALERAIAMQTHAARQLKTVLAHMVQAEGFAEAVQLLHELEKAQGQVQEETSQARQEQIRRLLEGPGPDR